VSRTGDMRIIPTWWESKEQCFTETSCQRFCLWLKDLLRGLHVTNLLHGIYFQELCRSVLLPKANHVVFVDAPKMGLGQQRVPGRQVTNLTWPQLRELVAAKGARGAVEGGGLYH
jgi:hypothetical protein